MSIQYVYKGFWRRLVGRLIDFFFVALISVGLIFAFTNNVNGVRQFTNPLFFYVWVLITITFMLFFMLLMPIMLHGSSIGYAITRIKVISANQNKSLISVIIGREFFYAIAWSFIIFLVMTIVNHTLINTIVEIKSKNFSNATSKTPINLSAWENIRITIVGTFSGIVIFIQMFIALTIIPDKKKQGWHDKASNALVVSINKIKIVNKNITTFLKPKRISRVKYEYIGGMDV